MNAQEMLCGKSGSLELEEKAQCKAKYENKIKLSILIFLNDVPTWIPPSDVPTSTISLPVTQVGDYRYGGVFIFKMRILVIMFTITTRASKLILESKQCWWLIFRQIYF